MNFRTLAVNHNSKSPLPTGCVERSPFYCRGYLIYIDLADLNNQRFYYRPHNTYVP